MSEPFEPRVDPDVDLRVPADRAELAAHPAAVLAAVAAGGALGALARAGLQHAFPSAPAAFPWATFGVNLSGCLLIGALMALLARHGSGRPLLRPFLGVGVLGGYTTFSTYAVDAHQALVAGAPGTALAYLGATVAGALAAVWLGDALTGRLLGGRATLAGRRVAGGPADGGDR
ncbi:fluoride efflux transporter CrcB [Micromonospora deserti]|uniref:Fluoride-specific ion channel FluC n=1 Tax=Micromonospora deserti TaxID=2070366 RepID=A0A2W2CJD1_9ACTN|nr:CrcB family protein [Micromonospora deserti]PZF99571.1 fluoride efflux transporter CrcB [Micromonospora deserti]